MPHQWKSSCTGTCLVVSLFHSSRKFTWVHGKDMPTFLVIEVHWVHGKDMLRFVVIEVHLSAWQSVKDYKEQSELVYVILEMECMCWNTLIWAGLLHGGSILPHGLFDNPDFFSMAECPDYWELTVDCCMSLLSSFTLVYVQIHS